MKLSCSNENLRICTLDKLPSEVLGKILRNISLEELNPLRSVSKRLKYQVEKANLESFDKVHGEVKKTREEIERKIMPIPCKRPSRRPRGHPLEGYLKVIKDVDVSMEKVLSEYRFINNCIKAGGLSMFFGLYIDTCHDCCAAVRRGCLSGTQIIPIAPSYSGGLPEHSDTKHFYNKLAKHLEKVTIPELLRHTFYDSVYSFYVYSPPPLPAQATPREASSALEKLSPSLLDKLFKSFTLAELNLLRSVSKRLKRYVEKRNEGEFTSVQALIKKTSTEIEEKSRPFIAVPRRPSQRPRDNQLHLGNHRILIIRLGCEMTCVWNKYLTITKTTRTCPMFFGGYIDACRELCAEVRRRALEGDDVIPIPFAYHGNGGMPEDVACSDLYEMLMDHMDNKLIPFYCRLNGWGIRKNECGTFNFYVINHRADTTKSVKVVLIPVVLLIAMGCFGGLLLYLFT